MQTTITSPARKWLAEAALHQIDEAPAAEAQLGTQALAALLAGTPAGNEAARLHSLTEQRAEATRSLRQALDDDGAVYP